MSSPLTLPADHFGLYVHVPFCVQKCRYCDFASRPLRNGEVGVPDQYIDALIIEAQHRRVEYPQPVHSIFIGGGTPTTLNGTQLRRLWHEVLAQFPQTSDVEISMEANPGTLNDDVLAALATLPISRVSLGVQSMHADELAMLGRIHTPEQVDEAVTALRAIGIPQINLDLIYALPGQTTDRWQATLRRALSLTPDHLSCYSLILEEGTPLTRQVEAGVLPMPGEEEEEDMSRISAAEFSQAGFLHYEVSNAARTDAVCRHNLGYWLGRNYLGLGVAATSTIDGLRWKNEDDVQRYLARVTNTGTAAAYAERLAAPERLLERVMLGLRLREGFNLAEAEAECGCHLTDIAGEEVHALQQEGWLFATDKTLCLTTAGYPLANMVVARLMAAGEKRLITG
ncbi:MAG TPA: radical SAM family heme chaperone HemW [Armatimonadota bacterium]|nr:radical SAM family heme chaperone HemW [Armatimonadota bacterium]